MGNSVSNSRDDNQVTSEKLVTVYYEFMKGGGCKDKFTAWLDCREKNKEDTFTKCADVSWALRKCKDAHSDYYQPILAVEKTTKEACMKDFEAFLAKEGGAEDDLQVRYCKFMEGGGCKESFTAWVDCMTEAEEDDIPKCRASESTLLHCMKAHSDYYQPMLALYKTEGEV